MSKKAKKILSAAAFVIALASLVTFLLFRVGVLKRGETQEKYTEWTSKPIGTRDFIVKVGVTDDVGEDGRYISLRFFLDNGEKESNATPNETVKDIEELSYDSSNYGYFSSVFTDKKSKTSYDAFFVPSDCELVVIGEEKHKVQRGYLKTPEGDLYFNVALISYPEEYSRWYEVEEMPELILVSEDGTRHIIENTDCD